MDRFSPVAPVHIRVLVLPIVQIERSRYLELIARLQAEAATIRLADVQPFIRDDEHLLDPRTPHLGYLLYSYTTSSPSEQHLQLSPFELFREPLLVLGIIDELSSDPDARRHALKAATEYLRERHPRVVQRQILALEAEKDQDGDGVVCIGDSGIGDVSALRSAIHKVSATFLRELATYTKAMQASPGVQTPGQTARTLQRTNSLREQDREPRSGYTTPTRSSGALSPVENNTPRSIPTKHASPPTSFDQIAGVNSSGLARSDSHGSDKSGRSKHSRASSHDRVLVQGFGSGTSQEKLRSRGKARVGIVLGSLYMIAGQWGQALRVLTEHTSKARVLGDHIWHGKGLEATLVCMLLHTWAGLDFQIPSICYPIAERMASGHSQRFSINLPSDFRTPEAAQKATVHRLFSLLPDLSKLILSLSNSSEGPLELPFVVKADMTIRLCKLLDILRREGAITQNALRQIVGHGPSNIGQASSADYAPSNNLSKSAIAELLSHAQPARENSVPTADHVAILSGTAAVFGSLGMERKKAMVMREVIHILSHAIGQARRRGAAEMGMHPAATLSAEIGAEAVSTGVDVNEGTAKMLSDLAAVYGVQFLQSGEGPIDTLASSDFGNESLKMEVMTQFAAFCEASADLTGILRIHTSLLALFGPRGAVDASLSTRAASLKDEEQLRFASTISRTVAVAKSLGLPNVHATYWDPFLVRGVEIMPLDQMHRIVDGTNLVNSAPSIDQRTLGNPLLYDPNAIARKGTTTGDTEAPLLVQDESMECSVLLQNPYDVTVDIESLELVAHGVELRNNFQPTALGPMQLQQVLMSVTAISTGDCKITGCRLRVSGCSEQVFPIISKPWIRSVATAIKGIGQEFRFVPASIKTGLTTNSFEHGSISAAVIPPLPLLTLENTSLLENDLMLLDGERRDICIKLYNSSPTPASFVHIVTSDERALTLEPDRQWQEIALKSQGTISLPFQVIGRPGVTKIQADFYYTSSLLASESAKHVRIISVPIEMTVNAALRIQRVDIIPLGDRVDASDLLFVSLDIGNAWQKLLSYSCTIEQPGAEEHEKMRKQEGVLTPAQYQRVFLPLSGSALDRIYQDGIQDIQTALLKVVRMRWHCEGRTGEVDISHLKLNAESRSLLERAPIALKLELAMAPIEDRISTKANSTKAGSFAVIRATIRSLMPFNSPLLMQLRTQQSDASSAGNDIDRRVVIAGPLQRVAQAPVVGQESQLDFTVCPFLSGELELVAAVRPALMSKVKTEKDWFVQKSIVLHVV